MTLEEQFLTLTIMIISSFIVGMMFDGYRVLFNKLDSTKWVYFVFDICFGVLSAIFIFQLLLWSNNGQLRLIIFITFFTGLLIYYLTFSKIFILFWTSFLNIVFKIIKVLIRLIEIIIIKPIKTVLYFIITILSFFKKFINIIINFFISNKKKILTKIKIKSEWLLTFRKKFKK